MQTSAANYRERRAGHVCTIPPIHGGVTCADLMLLAVITSAGDTECRAAVYLLGELVTTDEGTLSKVRGNLNGLGLALVVHEPAAPIADGRGTGGVFSVVSTARKGARASVSDQPVKRDVIKLG
jgi:hypothetical protein